MKTCTKCDRPAKARGLCSHHYNAVYYAEHAEEMRERARRWYEENPERAAEARKRRDPAKLRLLARKHYRANRLTHIGYAANQKARRLGAPGVLTGDAIAARFAYFGYRCWVCGDPCADESVTVDHVKPFHEGGPNWPSNIRPACAPCNFSKRKRVAA